MKEDGIVKASFVAVAAGHALDLMDSCVETFGFGVGDVEHTGVECRSGGLGYYPHEILKPRPKVVVLVGCLNAGDSGLAVR